jgi:hypothetical protein
MKSVCRLVCLHCTLLFLSIGALSQEVPRLIKFSGSIKLADNSAPATLGLTFALYSEQQGGAPLWQETQNVTLDAQGHYTVVLGTTRSDGIPMDLFAGNTAKWLGVQVQGQAEQPRVLLVSVPYALKAGDAETLGGRPASSFVTTAQLNAGGVPSSSRVQTATANGSIASGQTIGGGGSGNFIAKFDATGLNLIDSSLYDNGTRIGMGTETPQYQLDLQNIDTGAGGASLLRLQTPSTNGARLDFISTSPNGRHFAFGSNFILGQGEFGIYDYTANANRFAIDANGKIGIGTITPSFLLDVQSSDATAAGANVMRIQSPSTNGARISFISTAPNGRHYAFGSNFILGKGEFGIYDFTANAARFFLDGSGNIGIGTVAPTQRLEVAGTLKLDGQGNGIVFPDNTVQLTASTGGGAGGTVMSIAAGPGLISNPNPITTSGNIAANLTSAGGDNGSSVTVARGDHLHDARYVQISPQGFSYSAASVRGRYAFSWTGGIPSGQFIDVVSATGTLQMDGNGTITSGTLQEFSSAGTSCGSSITGQYTVSTSGQGSAVVSITPITPGCPTGSASFEIEVTQQGSSLVFAETDNSGWIAGTAIRQ